MSQTTKSLCEVCGTSLEGERGDRFCSRECFNISQRNRVEVRCEVCGGVEEVTETRAEDYRTCSRECLNTVQSEEFHGEKNPNYDETFDLEKAVADYESGLNAVEVGEKQGVSSNMVLTRLREAGVEIRDGGWPRKVDTKRGEKVRSYYEKQVADWMFTHGIDYEYEPEGFGPYTPDFVVDGTVVEMWGVTDSPGYDERRRTKEKFYASRNITLISVEPDDIGSLDERIERLKK